MYRATPWRRHDHRIAIALGAVVALGCGVVHAGTDANDTTALTREAVAFEHGEGVAKDQLKAATLYCRAARAGDAEAQYALGWMYTNGRGVPRNDEMAAGLFDLALAQGHLYAERARHFVAHAHARLPDCMRPPVVAHADEAAVPLSELPAYKRKVVEIVRRLAPRYDVEPALALAVISVESNFNAAARSPKNAQGLMQLIPATAERFNVKNALDPIDNIKGGLAYLRWLLSYYRGQVELAVAAYNAGEGAVDRYRGVPPYPETRDYVRKVQRLYTEAEHPYDDSVAQASPAIAQIAANDM